MNNNLSREDIEFLNELQGLLYKYKAILEYSNDLGIYFCLDDFRLIETSEISLDANDIYKLKENKQ